MARRQLVGGKNRDLITIDNLDAVRAELEELAMSEVLVGFPEETTDEGRDPAEDGQPLTNAALAYIHDNGAPEVNIPARPFMIPAIEGAQKQIADQLARTARQVLVSSATGPLLPGTVARGLAGVGIAAERAIKMKINEGIPPPLSEYTLRERARKGRKGAQAELDARRICRHGGNAQRRHLCHPLSQAAQGVDVALINPGIVASSPFLSQRFWLTTQEQVISDKGRATAVPDSRGVRGIVNHASAKDLERLPEGQYAKNVIVVISRTQILGPTPGRQPDIITWAGTDFLVLAAYPYPQYGAGWSWVLAGSGNTVDSAPDLTKDPDTEEDCGC